jgi:uncharacterized protein involved in exopolysaccharide biosynthesis
MSERSTRIVAVPAPDPAGPPPSGIPSPADNVDLIRFIVLLWAYRYVIAAVTLLGAAAGFTIAIMGTRKYEATAVLTVLGSKLSEGQQNRVDPANFRPVIMNNRVAQKIVEQFHLDQPPYNYTAALFLERAAQLDEVRNTTILRLSVRLQDPALSANVANAFADSAVAYTKSISESEGVRARDMMKAELDRAAARLKQASDALGAFNRSSQLELAAADVDALVEQRRSIPALVAQAEGRRAGAAQAERELADRAKLDVTTRTVLEDPAATEAVRTAAPDGRVPLSLRLKSESINQAYQDLEMEAAQNRVELARAERQLQELAGIRRTDAATLAKIRTFYEKKAEHNQLELERTLAEKAYTDVVARYEGARLQVATRSTELQVIDAAVAPYRPMPRGVVWFTVTLGIVAFAFSTIAALLVALWREGLSPLR